MAKLFFKYGTMKSGKTAHLLMTKYNYESQDKRVLVYTSATDNRWGAGRVESRIGLSSEARIVTQNIFDEVLDENRKSRISCILVDESQFLDYFEINSLCQIVDLLDIPVICYGLKTDFQNKLFEGSKTLLEMADEFDLIKTVCEYNECGKKATMNLRMKNGKPVREGDQIQLGDEEYIPVCRKHYYNGY